MLVRLMLSVVALAVVATSSRVLTPENPGKRVRPGPVLVLLSLLSPGSTNLLGLGAFLCGLVDTWLMLNQ